MMEESENEKETPYTDLQKGDDQKLHRLFKSLEQEWDSIKQSRPRTLRGSSADSCSIFKALQLLDDSPKSLMSSLQKGRRSHPSEGLTKWRVRNNDLAALEILRERRAALESGNLKGRRLFEDVTEVEIGDGTCSGCWDIGIVPQESEVRSIVSFDSDDDDDAAENENENENENEKESENAEGKDFFCPLCCQYGSNSSSSSSSPPALHSKNAEEEPTVPNTVEMRRRKTSGNAMLLLVVLLVVGVCFIISRKSSGYVGEEVILVPT